MDMVTIGYLMNYVKNNAAKLEPKGIWEDTKSYAKGEVVGHEGLAYIAIDNVPAGTDIEDEEYWMPFALKGEVNFTTFDVDPETGKLTANYTQDDTDIEFTLNDNGHLEVNIP